MTKTCINHPKEPIFKHDPFCESMLCKECYKNLDLIYQECYRKENENWLVGKEEEKRVVTKCHECQSATHYSERWHSNYCKKCNVWLDAAENWERPETPKRKRQTVKEKRKWVDESMD